MNEGIDKKLDKIREQIGVVDEAQKVDDMQSEAEKKIDGEMDELR